MKAFYCDKCKKLCKGENSHVEVTFDRYSEDIFNGDLCDNCQDKLEDWLEDKK
jgi:RNase P subunit RPR2